jgi:hypothetical protein
MIVNHLYVLIHVSVIDLFVQHDDARSRKVEKEMGRRYLRGRVVGAIGLGESTLTRKSQV